MDALVVDDINSTCPSRSLEVKLTCRCGFHFNSVELLGRTCWLPTMLEPSFYMLVRVGPSVTETLPACVLFSSRLSLQAPLASVPSLFPRSLHGGGRWTCGVVSVHLSNCLVQVPLCAYTPVVVVTMGGGMKGGGSSFGSMDWRGVGW